MFANWAQLSPTRDNRRLYYGVGAALLIGLILLVGRDHYGPSHGQQFAPPRPVNLDHGSGKSHPGECRPYESPGFLNYDPNNPHANRWTPFLETCKAPALMASFVKNSWAKVPKAKDADIFGTEFVKEPLGPDGQPWLDTEWARGKTVLILGDSVLRYMADHFCHMAAHEWLEVTPDHPWSPKLPENLGTPMPESQREPEPTKPVGKRDGGDGKQSSEPQDWKTSPIGNPSSHRPHYCYIPGMDFMIIQVFFFGLDQEQFFHGKAEPDPPYTMEERLNVIVQPLLHKIRDATGREPDLTYVNSGIWDVARFVRQDILNGADGEASLSYGRLHWYRNRVRQVLVKVSEMLPRSHVKWSSTHYPLRVLDDWFFDGTTPVIKLNRLVELHEAAVSAIIDTEDATARQARSLEHVGINFWGVFMRGMERLQNDNLHPSMLPGGYLWADMMLYDLRELVTGSSQT